MTKRIAKAAPESKRRAPKVNDESQPVPVWTWRDAIRKSRAPAYTKHICNMIANYISDVGEGCYPGVKSLMADSGLSNRSVATHLENAVAFGLLEIRRECGKDGRYKRTRYLPRFQSGTELPRASSHVSEAHVDRPSEPPSHGPREAGDKNRVNLVQKPCEGGSRELSTKNYPKNTPMRAVRASEVSKSDFGSEGARAAPSRPPDHSAAVGAGLSALKEQLGQPPPRNAKPERALPPSIVVQRPGLLAQTALVQSASKPKETGNVTA